MTSIFWRSTVQPPKTRPNFKPKIRVIFGVPKKKCYNFFWGPFSLKSKQLGYQLGSGINGDDRFLGLQMSGEVVAFSNLCFTVAGTDSTTPPLVLSETWTPGTRFISDSCTFSPSQKGHQQNYATHIYTVQILFQGGIFSFYVGFRGCRCSFSIFPFFQQEVPLHPWETSPPAQVLVPRDDTLLGRSALVKIHRTTVKHVEGYVVMWDSAEKKHHQKQIQMVRRCVFVWWIMGINTWKWTAFWTKKNLPNW